MFTKSFDFQSPLNGVYLQDVLRQKNMALQKRLEREVPRVLQEDSNEEVYISQVIQESKIVIPVLDFTPEHVRKTERYEQKHGSQLVGQVFFSDRMYRVWVVTFGIPYTGEIDLLQYVPRNGAPLWSVEVFLQDQHLCFEAQTLDSADKDVQRIKAEKEKTLAFLQTRLEALTPDLEVYNGGIENDVRNLFESMKQKYRKDKDLLEAL